MGISKEKLEKLNYQLQNREYEGKSIGVTNANERIRIAYGEKYGIKLEINEMKGVRIVVKLPNREV